MFHEKDFEDSKNVSHSAHI